MPVVEMLPRGLGHQNIFGEAPVKGRLVKQIPHEPYQRGAYALTAVVPPVLNHRNRRMSISSGPLLKRFSQFCKNNSATR